MSPFKFGLVCLFLIVSQVAAESGSILVRNNGGYVATFSVSYTDKDGKSGGESSGDFTLGVNKEIVIPEGSTNIYLKVQEYWLPTLLTTIFTKSYPSPIQKCFQIYGTTLNPGYSEIDC